MDAQIRDFVIGRVLKAIIMVVKMVLMEYFTNASFPPLLRVSKGTWLAGLTRRLEPRQRQRSAAAPYSKALITLY